MRSIEEKGCHNNIHGHGPVVQEISGSNAISLEFIKGNAASRSGHHTALGKPTPSKWDDAQKWLVGLSRGSGDKNQTKPRNSNADDRRLIVPVPHKEEEEYYSSGEEDHEVEEQAKKVDCDDESIWRINKSVQNSIVPAVRSICVRDMGTEMTPIASQEPSRTATPVRARTPTTKGPVCTGSSTSVGNEQGYQTGNIVVTESRREALFAARAIVGVRHHGQEEPSTGPKMPENTDLDQASKLNSLETRAMAWDEAERAKYMARYKREEMKIQAWENHEKGKAEMEMRKMEVKAERLRARAQEKLANKLARTKRIAEEKRGNAEAKLNENAIKTSEKADYIRRTGHLPSSFSFKLPSLCW